MTAIIEGPGNERMAAEMARITRVDIKRLDYPLLGEFKFFKSGFPVVADHTDHLWCYIHTTDYHDGFEIC